MSHTPGHFPCWQIRSGLLLALVHKRPKAAGKSRTLSIWLQAVFYWSPAGSWAALIGFSAAAQASFGPFLLIPLSISTCYPPPPTPPTPGAQAQDLGNRRKWSSSCKPDRQSPDGCPGPPPYWKYLTLEHTRAGEGRLPAKGQKINILDMWPILSLSQLCSSAVMGSKQPQAIQTWMGVTLSQENFLNSQIWISSNFHVSWNIISLLIFSNHLIMWNSFLAC